MALYFEEGFADGQNGRAELTQEPRTSVLVGAQNPTRRTPSRIQKRENGSSHTKDPRVAAHEDQ
jgi:hypothetical protein